MFLDSYMFSIFYRILSYIHFFFLNYIGNALCITHYFSGLNTFSCIIGIFVIWFIIHSLYFKALKALLKRMSFPELDRNRLTEAAWSAGFCIGTIPLSITKLHSVFYSINAGSTSTFDSYFKEFLSYTDNGIPAHVTICFVLICSYLIHQSLFSLSSKGCGMECMMQISFCIFFICSYTLRRFQLGLVVLILLGIPNFIAELTRVFYIAYRKQNSLIVYCTFASYSVCWAVLFVIVLPKLVLYPLFYSEFSVQDTILMKILILAVWTSYWLHFCTSPVAKLIKNYILTSKKDVNVLMEKALFSPPSDQKELIDVLFRVRNDMKERCSLTGDKLQTNALRSSHGRTFYQTFRCMMTIRRKVRQNRLKKEQLKLSKQQPVIEKLGFCQN